MKKNYDYLVGKTIQIINMEGEYDYEGRVGVVKSIDSIGQLHGTWGGLAVIPEKDDFIVIQNSILDEYDIED